MGAPCFLCQPLRSRARALVCGRGAWGQEGCIPVAGGQGAGAQAAGPLRAHCSLLWARPESAAAPSAQPAPCRGARSSLQTCRAFSGLLMLLVWAVPADGSPPSRRVKRAHFPGGHGGPMTILIGLEELLDCRVSAVTSSSSAGRGSGVPSAPHTLSCPCNCPSHTSITPRSSDHPPPKPESQLPVCL